MRRVYYAYALRALSGPWFVHAAVLALSLLLLTRIVSVPDVWRNLMEVKVGEMFGFFWGALTNTHTLTLVTLGVIALTLVSLLWRLFEDRQVVWELEEGSMV